MPTRLPCNLHETLNILTNPHQSPTCLSEKFVTARSYIRATGVRRLPVVNNGGGLFGILALHDMLELLAEEMLNLAKLVKHECKKETINRR
jgi:CBS domain-containing protein